MSKRFNEEHSLQDVLKEFIDVHKLHKGIDKVDAEQAWKSLMGSGVVSYTEEVVLKKGTLYVKLSSAVLRDELSYGKEKIIRMINENLGKKIINHLVLR